MSSEGKKSEKWVDPIKDKHKDMDGKDGKDGKDGMIGVQGERGSIFKCIERIYRGITVESKAFNESPMGIENQLLLDLSNGNLFIWMENESKFK